MAILFKKGGKLVIREEWWSDDIIYEAKKLRYTLTEDQVEHIMEELVELYDANEGINWSIIHIQINYWAKQWKLKKDIKEDIQDD